MFHNKVYIPMTNNKYIGGSISGLLFPDDIKTYDEIIAENGNSSDKHECKDFHDMCKQWGSKD